MEAALIRTQGRNLFAFLTTVTLVAVAFAGCLQAETTKGPAVISRVHTVFIDPAVIERLDQQDDPDVIFRELVRTQLVIRGEEAGEYTVEFTRAGGASASETITLAPGTPVTISDVESLAPVVLKKAGETEPVAVRAGINGAWFHVGDIPLGFNLTTGAKSTYDFKSSAREGFSLTNFKLEEEGMPNLEIKQASFDIRLPVEGKASWQFGEDTGEGNELTLTGSFNIPPADDLATVEIDAIMDGQPGTAGLTAGVSQATGQGSAKFWWKDAQPVAAQVMGGNVNLDPQVVAWADGFFAEFTAEGDFSCSGKSKADRCEPSELEPIDESFDAMEKEEFDVEDYPRIDDLEDTEEREEAQKWLARLQALFAMDIQTGDAIHFIAEAKERDMDPSGYQPGEYNVRFEFSLTAAGIEDVTVPAGKFTTLKLVEETRTTFDVANVPHPDDPERVALRQFAVNETVAKSTFWIDSTTYQPVKMEASTPINVDALVKRLVDSFDPSVWDALGGRPIENEQYNIVLTAESSYQLSEHSPSTHLSALTGLILAHTVAGAFIALPGASAAQAMTAMPWMGPQHSYDEATYGGEMRPYPTDPHFDEGYYDESYGGYEPPPTPMFTAEQDAVAAPGSATFTVMDVTPGVFWYEISVMVDDEPQYPSRTPGCTPPTEDGSYVTCRGTEPRGFDDEVLSGDKLTVKGSSGQVVSFVYGPSGETMFMTTIS